MIGIKATLDNLILNFIVAPPSLNWFLLRESLYAMSYKNVPNQCFKSLDAIVLV